MNHKTNSSVSVIIPAYNGSQHIGDALQSILQQTVAPSEIVVVDDGSTDDTAEIVRSYGERIKYVYKVNGGVASARNLGIRLTTGNYLAMLDQDDWWPNDMLAMTLAKFESEPELGLVKGLSKIEFEEGAFHGRFGVEEHELTTFHPLVGSVLFSRASFEKIGFFDEDLLTSNDVDWFNRAREASLPMAVIPVVTLYHRRHAGNTSNDSQFLRSEMMKAMKLSLDRR